MLRHTNINTYVQTRAQKCTYVYMHTQYMRTRTYTQIHAHIYMHAYIHTYMHTRKYANKCIGFHVSIHLSIYLYIYLSNYTSTGLCVYIYIPMLQGRDILAFRLTLKSLATSCCGHGLGLHSLPTSPQPSCRSDCMSRSPLRNGESLHLRQRETRSAGTRLAKSQSYSSYAASDSLELGTHWPPDHERRLPGNSYQSLTQILLICGCKKQA